MIHTSQVDSRHAVYSSPPPAAADTSLRFHPSEHPKHSEGAPATLHLSAQRPASSGASRGSAAHHRPAPQQLPSTTAAEQSTGVTPQLSGSSHEAGTSVAEAARAAAAALVRKTSTQRPEPPATRVSGASRDEAEERAVRVSLSTWMEPPPPPPPVSFEEREASVVVVNLDQGVEVGWGC